MQFSERKGIVEVSKIIQKDFMTESLRNSLWNMLFIHLWDVHNNSDEIIPFTLSVKFDEYLKSLFLDFLKYPLHKKPNTRAEANKFLESIFFDAEWYKVYDFLEFTINFFKNKKLNLEINDVLARELSAYRVIHNLITQIPDSTEIIMLEEALSNYDFPGVTRHLIRSLELLSDRDNPDYRNSIKESISAVESLVSIIVGKPKSPLGAALKLLNKQNKIHPALIDSFSSLYGYTSDENGIRHSMLEEPNLTVHDANFFLFSCTSFINYLKSKM